MVASIKPLPLILLTVIAAVFLTLHNVSQHYSTLVEDNLSIGNSQLCNKNLEKQKLTENRINQKQSIPKTTIVSAADSEYYEGVKNLIGSVNFWDSDRSVMIYNLGFTKDQLEQLALMPRVTVYWPLGIPSYLPKHVETLGTFTWKAIAIDDALDRTEKVFWIDAGSDFRGPLDRLDEALEEDGFFFVGKENKGTIGRLHNIGTFNYFNASKSDFKDKIVVLGGYQGYMRGSFAYHKILKPLLDCSSVAECMVPPGSSLHNHRYDQTALSILVHRLGNVVNSKLHDDASPRRQRFAKNCTQPSKILIHTARNTAVEYQKYIKWKGGVTMEQNKTLPSFGRKYSKEYS